MGAHCNKDAVCDGKDQVKFGDLASLEAKLCTLKASLDMCKCTGSSNEYECTKTGKAHCATGQVCDGIDEVKFGNLRQIESEICDVNMCKCTGNSNEYECIVTGKAHCNRDAVCDGKDQVKFGDLASLEAKICTPKASLDMCKCTGSSNEYECTKTGKAHCNKDAVCDGKDEVEFGDLASLEAKLCTPKDDMCKCTGSSNEYECTVTGK